MKYSNELEKLKDLAESNDPEYAHIEADLILCNILNDLGYNDIVDAWKKVKKWFA